MFQLIETLYGNELHFLLFTCHDILFRNYIIVKQEGVYVYLVEGFYSKSSFGSIIFNISNLIKLLFFISYMSKIICVSV